MSRVLIHNARVLTLSEGSVPRRGAEARNLSVIENGHVLLGDTEVLRVGPGDPPPDALAEDPERRDGGASNTHTAIDARGRVVMPAFIDAHTHACWAGDRLDEWDRRRAGASYLDILNTGGGIMSTVRAVRAASPEALTGSLVARLARMRREGAAACEVKSGYGLETEAELKMLRAIHAAGQLGVARVTPTALLGHAIDPDRPGFVEYTLAETLPAVSAEFPGVTIDAYCEAGAWSVEDCRRLFERAAELGHPFRVHADQFTALGMTRQAVELGARSVDHLEASAEADLAALAGSDTFGVMLPATGFHLDGRYANGRRFLDLGGALVLASNYNPGSAPCSSMPFVVALVVRELGLTVEEAITACTVNAASLLGLPTGAGRLVAGAPASVVMLRHTDERLLAYEFGGDPAELVVCDGRIARWTGDDADRTIIRP